MIDNQSQQEDTSLLWHKEEELLDLSQSEEMLEEIVGGGGLDKLKNAIKNCVACGKPPATLDETPPRSQPESPHVPGAISGPVSPNAYNASHASSPSFSSDPPSPKVLKLCGWWYAHQYMV